LNKTADGPPLHVDWCQRAARSCPAFVTGKPVTDECEKSGTSFSICAPVSRPTFEAHAWAIWVPRLPAPTTPAGDDRQQMDYNCMDEGTSAHVLKGWSRDRCSREAVQPEKQRTTALMRHDRQWLTCDWKPWHKIFNLPV
jgi:hypothetical protein